MPAGLADKLRAAAEANNRSMNAEIVARLEESFQSQKIAPISANDMKLLLETDGNAKRVFAEQMQKSTSQLLKEDADARTMTLELLTAAILMAEDRRKNLQPDRHPLSTEEAIDIVQAAKSQAEGKRG